MLAVNLISTTSDEEATCLRRRQQLGRVRRSLRAWSFIVRS